MADTTAKKTNSAFLNYVKNDMIRERSKTDGTKFYSVSVPCKDSASGYGNLTVNVKQVIPSTLKNGTPKEGFSNVMLGNPDGTHKVSIKLADGSFKDIVMKNADIREAFEADRKAYRASKNEAKAEG